MQVVPRVRRHWFPIALILVAAVGLAVPPDFADRIARIRDVAVPVAIFAIFLCSGCALPTGEIGRALRAWPGHLLVQGFSFAAVPALVWCALPLLALAGLDPALRDGFVVLACMPTTVTSCVVFTRTAGGDAAFALCNATLGNALGVVVAPLLILLILGRTAAADPVAIWTGLGFLVLLPVALGQGIRALARGGLRGRGGAFSAVSQCCLLVIVFPAFVAARAAGGDGSPWATLLAVAVWAVVLRLVLLAGALLLARIASDDPARRRAVVFTASEKTLALGLPLAVLLFADDPRLALVTLPLIVFHPLQLLIDAGLATRWAGRPP